MSVKVSVIIPVYRVEQYIGACLDSVRNQTLKELEIICIDDAGGDASAELVRRAMKDDPRIRLYVNERNLGLAASRNRGLELASGDYVYFLDSDDMLETEALETLSERGDRMDLEVQIFGMSCLFETPELKERFGGARTGFSCTFPEPAEGRGIYIRWMKEWEWMPSQPRYFYRRSFLQENSLRFVPGLLHEDEPFAFDVLMKAHRVRVTEEPFFIRRFRRGSIMTSVPSLENYFSCVRIIRHIEESGAVRGADPELRAAAVFYMKKLAEDARRKYAAACGAMEIPHCPAVSVIIPVYNAAPWLDACLQSVLSQDLRDIEVLLADDASSDGSRELLEYYEAVDPRVRVFSHDVNSGPSWGRNLGIREARGTFLYMLDADDLLAGGALSQMEELCRKDDLDVLGFENRQFTDDPALGKEAGAVLFSYRGAEGLYTGPEALEKCVTEDIMSPSVPTFMMRRTFLKEEGISFTEGILHEDIGFILELFWKARRVRLVSRGWFLRRYRAGSIMTSAFSARNAEGYLRSFLRSFDLEEEQQEAVCPESGQQDGRQEMTPRALGKWRRDVFGRICQLYLSSEETLYREAGGFAGREARRFFETLKLVCTGRGRAGDILGDDMVRRLEEAGAVYICGTGQYGMRMLDAAGALNVEIRGILTPEKDREFLRGFRVYRPEEAPDKSLPAVLAVSHYRSGMFEKALREAGFCTVLHVRF